MGQRKSIDTMSATHTGTVTAAHASIAPSHTNTAAASQSGWSRGVVSMWPAIAVAGHGVNAVADHR